MRAFAAGLLVLAACAVGFTDAGYALDTDTKQEAGVPLLRQAPDSLRDDSGRPPIPPGVVADPGFEGGSPNADWAETTVSGFAIIFASTPRTGTYAAWFGGIAGAYEKGELTQNITIPDTADASFDFYLHVSDCDSASDYLSLTVDGAEVWRVDGSSALCGTSTYTLQTADFSAWADGGSHTLQFVSETFSNNTGASNFRVDDLSLSGGLWFFKIGTGVPGPGDCSSSSHAGRMAVDPASGKLYVCDTSGWVTK